MAMTGNEIRKSFIGFFESKGHKHIRSSSLVPINDPTILFTNAGMNQFKDYFLGNQVPEFKKAVTSQKVMRAGGKHNDLENVGRTDRHHTFFEMLGNFSFGDYFKKEAISYAWEYLTEILKLPVEKLAVSVFEDDEESYTIWHDDIGISKERIAKLGEKENFWSMGDTGPCGPCSEIHYAIRPVPGNKSVQTCLEDDDGTFLEIWNLVFMQYNKETDGTMVPLPKPSIDTGMGIERIASVVQNQQSNYGSDLLSGLVSHIKLNAPDPSGSEEETEVSSRIIADHIRAACFLIADGVMPSNEGRGYVLRRIIRRASRHGKELGYPAGFFSELVDEFVPMMADPYAELEEAKDYIKIILDQEERRFSATLNQGLKILEDLIADLKKSNLTVASGEDIFKLYDTYGFPVDLADDVLQDNGFSFNHDAFEAAMNEQRERAKSAQDTRGIDLKVNPVYLELLNADKGNEFIGYDTLETRTTLTAVIKDKKQIQALAQDDKVEIVIAQTPFYAESGGQIGDQGEIVHDDFKIAVFDTQKPVVGLSVCHGKVISTSKSPVPIVPDMPVTAKVSEKKRLATERNHTATHLLQAALRNILGEHVKQSGSLVTDEKLRFDFTHYAPLTRYQLQDVENFINQRIRNNEPVTSKEMSFDEAAKSGAMAIFGEKYGDRVRVITAGSSSKELCGGCHTSMSGNIGLLKITSEESIASGIRRIEAVTGEKAFEFVQTNLAAMEDIAQMMKVPFSELKTRTRQLIEQLKEKEKTIEQLQKEIQKAAAEQALSDIKTVGNTRALIKMMDENVDLKSQAFELQKGIESGVVMLGKVTDGTKISVVLSVSKDLMKQFNAGNLIKELSPIISGRGGGSPNIAQCGGSDPEAWRNMVAELEKKLESVS